MSVGERQSVAASGTPRWLRNTLLLISLGSGLLMIAFGAVSRIEYDGWWHVFIARASDWPAFWRETYSSAHPPLYFLLLKLASYCLGFSRLAYRSVSILGGVASILLVGSIASRLYRNNAAVVVATVAFATSTVTIIIANEVRSYMLAGMFLLVAIASFLDVVEPTTSGYRSRIVCCLGLTLGVLTHYSILFVLPIFGVLPFVLKAFFPGSRRCGLGVNRRNLMLHFAMMSIPLVVGLAEYVFHIRKIGSSTAFSYLSRFFYSPGENLPSYVWRVLVEEISLFGPIDLLQGPRIAQGLAVAAVLIGMVALLSMLRKEGEPGAAVIPLIVVFLVGGLLAVSIIGRYPFGGTLRHQYIVFPVALLTFFLCFDRCLDRLSSDRWRIAALAALVIVLVVSTVSQWTHIKIQPSELGGHGHQRFRAEFPDAENIYLDQYSLILFFTHEHDARWEFDLPSQTRRTDRIVVRSDDRDFVVYRDRKWQAHLDDPGVFRHLRKVMRASGLDRIFVYHLERIPRGESESQEMMKEGNRKRLEKLGRRHGLVPKKIVRPRKCTFVEFELAE